MINKTCKKLCIRFAMLSKKISIQIKAALLFAVFALNMAVGFACAMGVDMGFNEKHHHNEIAAAQHSHHKDADKDNDGCCNTKAINLQNADKDISQNNISLIMPLPIAVLHNFYAADILKTAYSFPEKQCTTFYYPPPPDIRILIQSFLI